MKNLKIRLIGLFIPLAIIATMVIPTKVLAANEGIQIILTESQDYIIYVENITGDFEFAISDNANAQEQDLSYGPATTDNAGNKVAIVTAYTYNTIKDKTNYIYVKSGTDVITKELDFTTAFNQSNMEMVETTTKRIKTEINSLEEERTENGVKKTTTVGVLSIVDDQNATYSYECTKLPAKNYSELMELAQKINNEYNNMTMYSKIELAEQFYSLYTKLIPTKWTSVENMQVLQPSDAQDGDNYVVFLKKVDANNQETIDVKFLTSQRTDSEESIPASVETKTVKETTKLPITYDSIILFVVLAVILIALAIVYIRMRKIQGKQK